MGEMVSSEMNLMSVPQPQRKVPKTEQFNPYLGINPDDGDGSFNVENMSDGQLPETGSTGASSIPGLDLLGGMLNMDEFRKELKSMSKDDLKEATNSLRGFLGTDMNKGASNLLDTMLDSIITELQDGDFISSGNPLEPIIKMAEKVATTLQDKASEKDIENLVKSTANFTSKYECNNGEDLPSGLKTQLEMIKNMMGQFQQ